MQCKNCGREIDNMWGICPHCGYFSGEFGDNFMNIARMLGGKAVIKQEGDSFVVILEVEGVRHAFRITPIDLEEDSSLASPAPHPLMPWHGPEPEGEPRKEREFEQTEEPETDINYVEDKIYIKVDLPGIPEEDIEIDSLENSIEVRAYRGKTRYFKLVAIPEDYHMVSKEILPEEVIITLKK
jgi:hypothetical protein